MANMVFPSLLNRILAKLPIDKLTNILRSKVFPFVSEGELLKVDLKVSISYSSIDEDM